VVGFTRALMAECTDTEVSVTLITPVITVSIILGAIARVRQLPDQGEKPGWAQFRRPDRWPWTGWAFLAVMSIWIKGALIAGYGVARPG
jgi:hypothetical protein